MTTTAPKTASVDAYVATKVAPEQQGIAALMCDLMNEYAPHTQAVIKWNQPVWVGVTKKPVAVMGASKKHMLFIFSRGAEFNDPYGLLEGEGEVSKHVRITSLENINRDALRDYIQQAVKLDAG